MKRSPFLSLSRDYLIFALAVGVLLVITGITTGVVIQYANKNQLYQQSIIESKNIHQNLANIFTSTNLIMSNMGHQIQKHGTIDSSFIYELFQQNSRDIISAKAAFSWSLFDWVDTQNRQIINSKTGITSHPKDMSMREYTTKSRALPWTLQFSKPAIGHPSKQWVIPAGTGITDYAGNYLGVIVVGFNIVDLVNSITRNLIYPNIRYIVIDNQGRVVLQSSDNAFSPTTNFFNFLSPTYFAKPMKILNKPLTIAGNSYLYYEKMENYPFIVLTGFKESYLLETYTALLLPRLLELLICGLFILILLFLFYRKIVSPILILAQRADALSRGKTDIDIPLIKTQEMWSLTKALIRVRWYIKTERALRSQLELTNQKLKQISLDKSNLVSLTSHELRGPLTVVDANAQIIKQQIYGPVPPKYLECVDDIHEASQELTQFVDDLLDEMKAEAGFYPIEIGRVNIHAIIHRAIKLNIGRAHRSHITFHEELEDNLPRIVGDAKRIRQVLNNLISNAIKYSPEFSTVTIGCRYLKNGEIEMSVSDQGFGMTPEDIEIAISPYGTIQNPNSSKVESTGLGLPLSKMIIEQHGAEFFIESTKWKGTTVRIIFPKDKVF
ncbi:MAG: sensor histidine kinase [Alphaproteobacteria bacterium]|nr:sensor histidine kinase [Alphaproteobacteria bacterium]